MTEQKKQSALYSRLVRFRGTIAEIERRSGRHRNTVRPHVNGEVPDPDPDIIRVAVTVLHEREARARAAEQMLAYQNEFAAVEDMAMAV